jgi:hypothetical protein
MLITLAVILLVAWLLGIVGVYTVGAFIHVLLVIAVVLFLVGIVSGRAESSKARCGTRTWNSSQSPESSLSR